MDFDVIALIQSPELTKSLNFGNISKKTERKPNIFQLNWIFIEKNICLNLK